MNTKCLPIICLGLISSLVAWAAPEHKYLDIYQNGYGSGFNICYSLKPDTVGGIIYTPIDMGAGVAWADRNIGAATPADGGTCFYWGDVSGEQVFSSNQYDGKYYPNVKTLVANSSTLPAAYDAATTILGSHWRMPTKQEIGMLNNFMFAPPPGTGGVESDYGIDQEYEPGVGLTCSYRQDPDRRILIPEADWYYPNKMSTKKVCFWTGMIGSQVNAYSNPQNSAAIHYTYSSTFNMGTYSQASIYTGMPVRAVYVPQCEVCTLTICVKAMGTYCVFYNNDGSCLQEENGTTIYLYNYICEKGQQVTIYPMRDDGGAGCGWLESDGKTVVKNHPNLNLSDNTFTVSSDMTFYADFTSHGGDGEQGDGGDGGDGGQDNMSLGSEASFLFNSTDVISGTTRYCTSQNSYWNDENFVLITARHARNGADSYFNIGIRTTNTQSYNGYLAPAAGTYQVVAPERYYDTDGWSYEEEYYYFNTTNDVVPACTEVCAKYNYFGACTSYAPITQSMFLSSFSMGGAYVDAAPYNDLSAASYVKVSEGKDGYYFLQVFDAQGNVLVSIGEPAPKTPVAYLLTWDVNGGVIDGNQSYTAAGNVLSGTPLVAPVVSRPGYTFQNWSPAVPGTMPTQNLTCRAVWTANTHTPYVVKHYTQDLGSTTYTLYKTETFYGTTDATVHPATLNITGFTAPQMTGLVIASDSSSVVEYRYARNRYTLTILPVENGTITVKNGEQVLKSGDSVEYGTTLTLTATANTGCEFVAWTGDGAAQITMDQNKTVGATFVARKQHAVRIHETVDGKIQVAANGNTYDRVATILLEAGSPVTISLVPNENDGFNFGWWLDGDDNIVGVEQTIRIESLNQDLDLYAFFGVNELVLEESKAASTYAPYVDKVIHKAIYKRSITANTWTPFWLPFDCDDMAAQGYDGLIYELYSTETTVKASNVVLNLNFKKTNQITACQPYLFYSRTAITNPSFTDVYMVGVQSVQSQVGEVYFRGTNAVGNVGNKDDRIDNMAYRYLSANKVVYSTSTMMMQTFRGYFYIKDYKEKIGASGVAPRVRIMVDGECIEELEMTDEVEAMVSKFVANGQLMVERDGIRYNATGTVLK